MPFVAISASVREVLPWSYLFRMIHHLLEESSLRHGLEYRSDGFYQQVWGKVCRIGPAHIADFICIAL